MRHLLLATALIAAPAQAANVIDQKDLVTDVSMASTAQTGLAQSFTPTLTSSTGAGIFIGSLTGSSGVLTIGLWSALPNAGGTQLTTGVVTATANAWADAFWSPVTLTAGTRYYLIFASPTQMILRGDVLNGYAGGNVFANNYAAYANYDFSFRTFAAEPSAAVPEPAAWALMVAGFGIAGVGVRRRPDRRVAIA
jgi:hypothetical protein